MIPRQIPDDLCAEDLYDFIKGEECRISICGSHGRNAYKDICALEAEGSEVVLNICRKGLYDSLPEYMFHPVNRFDGISENEKAQKCAAECEAQQREIADARQFFSMIDSSLFLLNVEMRNKIREYVEDNKVLHHIIADDLSETERSNRFISKVLCFLPQCKRIRGNRTLISMILRKIFMEEGLTLRPATIGHDFADSEPCYQDSVGGNVGDMFVGNCYCENVLSYELEFWPSAVMSDDIHSFIKELEEFRVFIQSYFFGVDERLAFSLINSSDPIVLSDDIHMTWLNYNTNII